MSEALDPIAIALRVTRALDAQGVVSTIGGSIASSIEGSPGPLGGRDLLDCALGVEPAP
jgi:hypothetical protein